MTDETQIETLADRYARLSKMATDLKVQAGRVGVHLFGAVIEAPASGPTPPNGGGVIGELRGAADDIEAAFVGLGRLIVMLTVHLSNPERPRAAPPMWPDVTKPAPESIELPAPAEPAPWTPPRNAVEALTAGPAA